jgi:S-adenosylmethionine:tRNA ribosyltransferase-isomerase
MPLPPYIRKSLADPDRYQTVYSRADGSAAAPTAGLHFTDGLLSEIRSLGVSIAFVTLHVGIGTFRPVKERDITKHRMHKEYYYVSEESASVINNAKKQGGRVFAVGTTSCRVLETTADENGELRQGEGWTEIFIYPGYKFRAVDALITNFHLPGSTLIMLVCAFAGREKIMEAYQVAVSEKYRFYSFGDAMLIL